MALEQREIFDTVMRFSVSQGWHLVPAKWNRGAKQSLLSHSFNVSSTALTIFDFLVQEHKVNGSERLRTKVILAGFFHDCAKSTSEFQDRYVKNGERHSVIYEDQREDQVKPILEKFAADYVMKTIALDKQLIESVTWIIVHTGSTQSLSHLMDRNRPPPEDGDVLVSEIVHVADVIMSQRELRKAAEIKSFTSEAGTFEISGTKVYLDFHEVSPIRGILTQYLHKAIEDTYSSLGMRPLAWYYNGTLYMSLKRPGSFALAGKSLEHQIKSSLTQVLEGLQEKMGRSAFGGLTQRVVSKPEFLFFSRETVRAFWGYVFNRPFTHKQFKNTTELDDKKRVLFEGLKQNYPTEDEERILLRLERAYVDFNLIAVLFGVLKEFHDKLGEEAGAEMKEIILHQLAEDLGVNLLKFSNLSVPVNTSRPEERLQWASILMSSDLWINKSQWETTLRSVLERSTQQMREEWMKSDDSLESVTKRIMTDIVHPFISEKSVVEEARSITELYEIGKTGRGTFTCQHCGGKSEVTATASIFPTGTEIYHDQLVAGGSLGGPNKLKVCTLCEFEFKLRSLFLPRFSNPYTLIVLPQVAISRNEREEWQRLLADIESGPIAGKYQPLRDLTWWAYKYFQNPNDLIPLLGFSVTSRDSENWIPVKTRMKQLERALARRYDDDESFESVFADIKLLQTKREEIKSLGDLADAIINGRAELRKGVYENLEDEQRQDQLVYNSPNFMVFLTSDFQKGEPEAVSKIRLMFIMILIAKLFCSSVMAFSDCRESSYLRRISGYALLPSDVSLKPLVDEFSDENGWLSIESLDKALMRLCSLFAINDILQRNDSDFGLSSPLRIEQILIEEKLPGKLLARLANQAKEEWRVAAIQKILPYLDTWKEGSVC